MNVVRVAFLGFGNVGRALHALLARRRESLARDYDIECVVTGVASRRIGWRADATGVNPLPGTGAACADIHEWLAVGRADVVFEAIALDPHSGQPALDYLRIVLEHGAHVVSANKGPLVYGYRALTTLAAARGRQYRFESAVMDGAPVFSLVRNCLPAAGIHAVRGVFTSTATVVLEAVERGLSIGDGIAEAHAPDREMFGFPRLKQLVEAPLGGEQLIDLVLAEHARFIGPGVDQEDDITMVTLQRSAGSDPAWER